jgi:hypothetical protein
MLIRWQALQARVETLEQLAEERMPVAEEPVEAPAGARRPGASEDLQVPDVFR